MVTISQGSIEYLALKVNDELGVIDELDLSGVQFSITDDEDAPILAYTPGTNTGMIALCLIDTTAMVEGRYKLFLKFTALPETPRLGPFYFAVSND